MKIKSNGCDCDFITLTILNQTMFAISVKHWDSNKHLSQETPYQWHYFDSFVRYTFLYPQNTSHDFYRSLKTSECNLSAFMIRQQIEFETK